MHPQSNFSVMFEPVGRGLQPYRTCLFCSNSKFRYQIQKVIPNATKPQVVLRSEICEEEQGNPKFAK